MNNTVRFGIESNGVRKIAILEWNELLTGQHEELVGAERMLSYQQQTTSGEMLYEGDILSLRASTIEENSQYWDSNMGRGMKEKNIDSYLLHLTSTTNKPFSANVYALKNGKPVQDTEMWGYEVEEDDEEDKSWSERGVEMVFIRYFLSNKATLEGNEWENPELLTPFAE